MNDCVDDERIQAGTGKGGQGRGRGKCGDMMQML